GWNRQMVLGNRLVFGVVNAGRRHFEAAVRDLEVAEERLPGWLRRLITRRLPAGDAARAVVREPRHIKTVLEFEEELQDEKIISTNRKAFFNYTVLERAEAGLVLLGSEVKSVREGGLNFRDSFVEFRNGELFLVGCRIGPYSHANIQNHAEERDRKLLLHKREILKLGGRATQKGVTIVPPNAHFKKGP